MNADLLSLPLCRLREPVKIRSRLLQAEFWLLPPGSEAEPGDAPSYSHEECRLLLALALEPDQLRAIHLTKRHFQGAVVLPADAGQRRRLYRHLLRRYCRAEALFNRGEDVGEIQLRLLARQLSRLFCHSEDDRENP